MKLFLLFTAAFTAPLVMGSPVSTVNTTANSTVNTTVATAGFSGVDTKPIKLTNESDTNSHGDSNLVSPLDPGTLSEEYQWDMMTSPSDAIPHAECGRFHLFCNFRGYTVVDGKFVTSGVIRDNNGIVSDDAMVNAHFLALMDRVMRYGDIYRHLNGIDNFVERKDFPWPIGEALDDYVRAWMVGYKNTLANADDAQKWYDELYEHVEHSKDARGQFWAYRFEFIARKDTEMEMKAMLKDLSKKQRASIKNSIRQAWKEEFGGPSWIPRTE